MAQPTAPVAEWTDEAVLGYDVGKKDHALLRMADIDIQDYEKARKMFRGSGARNRPETVEKLKQEFLQAKRPLLTKLMELRADAAKAQCEELRTASAVVRMTALDAEQVVDDMAATMTRAANKVLKLHAKHAALMVQQNSASKRVDRGCHRCRRGAAWCHRCRRGADSRHC